MKATETNFLQFLKGPKQFVIPIYQRTYSWTKKQCAQLWDDIERISEDVNLSAHFLGSIVYVEKGLYHVTSVPHLLVIDGQQRLTTLSLILSAFSEVMEEQIKTCESITSKKVRNYFLFNAEEDDDTQYKLLLTQKDRQTYIDLLERNEFEDDYSKRIVENQKYFKDKIMKSQLTLDEIYQALNKLIVVDIALDRDKDNPQLIFESLNSTGLDLSQADLIRNYFLMGLQPKDQEYLYNKYWYKLEMKFDKLPNTSYFDRFIRDYITLKTGVIPKIGFVYEAFKSYVTEHAHLSTEEIIVDVYSYGQYYVNLNLLDKDPVLENVFRDIRGLRVDTANPFLMQVYNDYIQNIINKDELITVFRLVESYVFRRAICSIPTNSLNNTFASLSKEIDKTDYLNSLKAAFLFKTSYRRFPSDEEFRRDLLIKDLYNFRNRNYLLRKLENHNRKEIVNVENYTIEHIMPQNKNLSVEWQTALGSDWEAIQLSYLHTLGNLTLTGYNSELSDRSFTEKLSLVGGFKDSPLWLNRSVSKFLTWKKESIEERANILAERAVTVWQSPTLSEDVLKRFKKNENESKSKTDYSIEHHANAFSSETHKLYDLLKTRILNIDSSVHEEVKKFYIAFKYGNRNFVDLLPAKQTIKIWLNCKFGELHDPDHLGRDVTDIGHRGNGDIEISLKSETDLEPIMDLIQQSFILNSDSE
ncbi:hypothetical protein AM233_19850 [Bacillus sp. FJAT-22058]|nr:hypothetical protein AM233_19850 [Bacillus sp. FJAT-22058]